MGVPDGGAFSACSIGQAPLPAPIEIHQPDVAFNVIGFGDPENLVARWGEMGLGVVGRVGGQAQRSWLGGANPKDILIAALLADVDNVPTGGGCRGLKFIEGSHRDRRCGEIEGVTGGGMGEPGSMAGCWAAGEKREERAAKEPGVTKKALHLRAPFCSCEGLRYHEPEGPSQGVPVGECSTRSL